ncbi:MAG: hypothetical protein R3A10_08935 [Caldilineaceae bacterium]
MTGTRETVAASAPTHDGAIAADQPAVRDTRLPRSHANTRASTMLLLADLRARQYARLGATDQVYLDYTGGGLQPDKMQAPLAMLTEHVLGNPTPTARRRWP